MYLFAFYFIISIIILYLIFKYLTKKSYINFKNNSKHPPKIPKIIHQTWKFENDEIVKKSKNSWLKHHPDYKYYFYTDHECHNFVKNFYPQYFNTYKNLKIIEQVDIWRYLVIHKYGGIYADIDTICIKNISSLLLNNNIVVGIEYDSPIQYLQWFFASVPKNPIFIELVNEIIYRNSLVSWFGYNILWFYGITNTYNNQVLWLTGPYVWTKYIEKYKSSIKIYKRCIFGSYDIRKNCVDKSYILHQFNGSWKNNWKKKYILSFESHIKKYI